MSGACAINSRMGCNMQHDGDGDSERAQRSEKKAFSCARRATLRDVNVRTHLFASAHRKRNIHQVEHEEERAPDEQSAAVYTTPRDLERERHARDHRALQVNGHTAAMHSVQNPAAAHRQDGGINRTDTNCRRSHAPNDLRASDDAATNGPCARLAIASKTLHYGIYVCIYYI